MNGSGSEPRSGEPPGGWNTLSPSGPSTSATNARTEKRKSEHAGRRPPGGGGSRRGAGRGGRGSASPFLRRAGFRGSGPRGHAKRVPGPRGEGGRDRLFRVRGEPLLRVGAAQGEPRSHAQDRRAPD